MTNVGHHSEKNFGRTKIMLSDSVTRWLDCNPDFLAVSEAIDRPKDKVCFDVIIGRPHWSRRYDCCLNANFQNDFKLFPQKFAFAKSADDDE